MTRIYNIKVNPELKNLAPGKLSLRWSNHAVERAVDKGLTIIYNINIRAGMVVEAEMVGREVTKIVVRNKGKGEYEPVYVLVPIKNSPGEWLVVTCWTNHRLDNHASLDTSYLTAG